MTDQGVHDPLARGEGGDGPNRADLTDIAPSAEATPAKSFREASGIGSKECPEDGSVVLSGENCPDCSSAEASCEDHAVAPTAPNEPEAPIPEPQEAGPGERQSNSEGIRSSRRSPPVEALPDAQMLPDLASSGQDDGSGSEPASAADEADQLGEESVVPASADDLRVVEASPDSQAPVTQKPPALAATAGSVRAEALELGEPPLEESRKDWYILKIQVNREDSIRDALTRRIKMLGLEQYFGDIVIPTEDVAEYNKSGKRRIVKRKLYPGYLLVNMAINDETWFLIRETPGVGDFTGSAGRPTPMDARDVERILRLGKAEDDGTSPIKTAIPFKTSDRVRVKDGYFQNFEGEVSAIDHANGRITVMINIFGRSTPVELEHWQVESV